jgi:hypothetical protein
LKTKTIVAALAGCSDGGIYGDDHACRAAFPVHAEAVRRRADRRRHQRLRGNCP